MRFERSKDKVFGDKFRDGIRKKTFRANARRISGCRRRVRSFEGNCLEAER